MSEVPVAPAPEPAVPTPTTISSKSRLAVTLLSFFLGSLGIHRFYLGKVPTAIAQLVLSIVGYATLAFVVGGFLLGAVGIWVLIDFIMAVAGVMKDKEGKVIKNW
jgi:TM2 domain-containing membrane protein YozV